MTNLSKLLEKHYIENSRYEIVPPAKTIKELESGRFIISDFEVSDEEIPILVRFMRTKQALKYVTSIEINKTSGSKVNRRRTNSALNSNGAKFFRELIHFLQNCHALESLTFDSVEISPVMASSMCRALAENCVGLRWLMFKDCEIGSDNGLKAMAPYLGRLQLQVLGLECCGLTDESFPYICSFLKAQECNSDALYWNATLRTDPYMDDKQRIREETGFVYSRGLVALSLFGNRFGGEGMEDFCDIMRKNYWLLGLNLAENRLTQEHLDTFVKNLKQNQVIQAVLLRNNPGLNSENAMKLYKSVFAKMQVSDDLGNNGLARLNLLGPTVSWMLKSWMRLQCEETRDLISSVTSPQGDHVENANQFDRTQMSLSTLGSVTAGAMVSRSPRRQREIEQKILFEEAKEYSVLAYTEPRKFSFSKSADVRSSSTGGQLDVTTNEHDEFGMASSRINDNEWGNEAPVVLSTREELATRNRASPSSSRRHHQPQPEIETDFSGWPDHFEMERPPSRNSVRPRTALAAPMLYSSAEKLPQSSIRSRSTSPLMTGRHSRETQEVYDIKDKDILSNHRYIPRYILSKKSGGGEETMVEERVVERRLRSSSADGVRVRGSLTKSQQDVSRAKSPPWRPPSSHHQDPKAVVRVPLAKNVSVFHRGNMVPEPAISRKEPTSSAVRKTKKSKKKAATAATKKSESPSHVRSKHTKDDMETYRAVSKSVVKATERLEKASAKLLSVAESLSESAMNHSHLSTASAVKSRRGSTPARGDPLTNGDDHPSHHHAMDLSHLSQGSESDIALEELVRARLNFNLRKTLNAALFQEGK